MKNQKLISRNVIKKFAKGGYGGGTFSDTGTSRKWNSNSNDTKRIEFEKDRALVMSGLMDPQEYKAKWFPNTEVLTIPGTNKTIVNGTGMSGADPLLSWFVGGSFSKSLPFLNKLAGKAVKNAMTKTAKTRVYKYSNALPVPVSTLPIKYTPKPIPNLTSKLLGTAALVTAAGMGYNEGNNNSKLKLENYLPQETTDLIRKLLESNNISNLQLALSNNTNWSKAKNSNTKLSPWSNNLNNQLTQKSNILNNNNLSNIRTSGNIWSLRSPDGSVKNFRDSVIDYQNSHSTNNDVKFNIPLGDVPVNENDSLIRETIPDVETMMPKSVFTNLRGSVRRNPILLTTSSSPILSSSFPEFELPSSLAEYRSLNPTLRISETQPVTPEEIMYLVGQGVDNKGFTIELIKAELLDNNIDIKDKSDEEIVKLFEKYLEEQNAKRNIEPPKYVAPTLQLTPSTSPFTGTTPTSVDLNRADVRAIMNHYGLNTTPSLRKAFRKYLAGDRSQDISFIDQNSDLHRDWVAPFVVYKKKGGRLVSRNPINRFKRI